MSDHFIPQLPDSAPFTPEQRAYLNGFFAGLFSGRPMAGAVAAPPPTVPHPLRPLSILFGSQTGNAERLAKRVAKAAGDSGFAPAIHDLAKYPAAQLASERCLLIITSTYGDGDPPDNAKAFWEFLCRDAVPKLPELRFSVCALGDSNYQQFCAFGKQVDERLEKLGGIRVHPRVDCDVDFEATFAKWSSATFAALGQCSVFRVQSSVIATKSDGLNTDLLKTEYSRSNPFPARLITNRKLNAPGSRKEVRHVELSLAGSGLNYEAGDALGVIPKNDPALVTELLAALGATGDEAVPVQSGGRVALREALASHYEITRISRPLLEMFAARTGDQLLAKVSAPDANGELTKFLWGRQIIDLLLAHPGVRLSPAEFVVLLRKLQPRLYSISSSPKAHPGEVHLTVGALRYESLGRERAGVCSTFLADRVQPETSVPVFVHHNKAFRPPASEMPLIMVGPGTGIAPFRAFLEERHVMGAKGKSWLFFGDQMSATDFLYRAEIEEFQRHGVLTRLDVAWSRDQTEKIYVQHRLLEHAREVFDWLEGGGAFYVCGDAARMAKDVDAALLQVIQIGSGKSAEQAADYVKALSASKRYQRDVY